MWLQTLHQLVGPRCVEVEAWSSCTATTLTHARAHAQTHTHIRGCQRDLPAIYAQTSGRREHLYGRPPKISPLKEKEKKSVTCSTTALPHFLCFDFKIKAPVVVWRRRGECELCSQRQDADNVVLDSAIKVAVLQSRCVASHDTLGFGVAL